MQQTPVLLPPNIAGGEGMLMLLLAPQHLPKAPPKNWNQKCAKGVGIATVVVAVVAFVCNIGWFSFQDNLAFVGVGFWAGIPLFVSGLLLTIGGFLPKKSLIVAALVMSILANVFGIGFVAVGAAQMNYSTYRSGYSSLQSDSYSSDSWYSATTVLPSSIGMGTFYVLLGLSAFGLLLTTSILSCYSACADCGHKVSPYPTIAYIPQGFIGSSHGCVYPSAAAGMQGMQQPPMMSYCFVPQGPMGCAPPAYPMYAGNQANGMTQVMS